MYIKIKAKAPAPMAPECEFLVNTSYISFVNVSKQMIQIDGNALFVLDGFDELLEALNNED